MKKILLMVILWLAVFAAFAARCLAGQAVLSWTAPTTNVDGTPLTDLTGYKIYYGLASGSYSTIVDVSNVLTHTINGLTDGTTFYFVATAYDIAGNESRYSNEVSKNITGTTGISTPTSLRVLVNGGMVALSWDRPNVGSLTIGYQVNQGNTPGLYTGIFDVGSGYPDSTPCVIGYAGCERRQYILNRVAPGNYYFAVRAYGVSTESGLSNEVSASISSDSTLPGDVSNFAAIAFGTGVRLSWTNPSTPDFSSLILSYSIFGNNGPWIKISDLKGIPSAPQTYDHLNLPVGKTYYYKIQTRDTSGNTTSTRHTEIALLKPPSDYPTTIANFTATPDKYLKEVWINGDWPINPYIKSAKLEYRIVGYGKKVLLGRQFAYSSPSDGIMHSYSNRLIGEKVEYTLTLVNAEGKQISLATAVAEIPKKLEEVIQCECGGGGEFEIVRDNADKDFPKTPKKDKKKTGGGFGCGTTKNDRSSGGGTDASAFALTGILLMVALRAKLKNKLGWRI